MCFVPIPPPFKEIIILFIKVRIIIKGNLEEILPSYEKMRSVYAHVHDAKKSSLTVGRIGTLGAAWLRRGYGAVAAHVWHGCGAGPRRD